mmetsp:Transcript_8877/g.7855  ORF Transcript_8877/g.7855 Transcript_8877/m.7855 type:complete len:138 (+) Transcript_8877:422-835(+)
MNEGYYNLAPSPRRMMKNSLSKTSFQLKVKRHGSIDSRKRKHNETNPYNLIEGLDSNKAKIMRNRSKINNSTNLPYIDDWKGQFISVNEFNSMVSSEMSMIRKIKKSKNAPSTSLMQVFKHNGNLQNYGSNSALHMI